ncbi:MAG: DUF4406 domain-containing protein [Mucilaginibacter sp.]|uniref:DUF7768 domain-containing protein n=1 Tax=Mucilaginibacter sp. TaxID=1882438 RepID=UPI003265D06A
MKIVYIAHPIGGDVKNNIAKVLAIVKDINLTHPDVVPFAPYIVDCLALDDSIPEQRKRGMSNNEHFISNRFIDEIWLFGDKISGGMQAEIELAYQFSIPVYSKSKGTALWK